MMLKDHRQSFLSCLSPPLALQVDNELHPCLLRQWSGPRAQYHRYVHCPWNARNSTPHRHYEPDCFLPFSDPHGCHQGHGEIGGPSCGLHQRDATPRSTTPTQQTPLLSGRFELTEPWRQIALKVRAYFLSQ